MRDEYVEKLRHELRRTNPVTGGVIVSKNRRFKNEHA